MTEFPHSSPAIEELLRESAPTLPIGLKSRTLTQCALAKHARKERLHRRWTWAVAGVLAVQMLTLARVDAQNAQLIAGRGAPMNLASVSFAQVAQSLQTRSREVALLMAPSRVG